MLVKTALAAAFLLSATTAHASCPGPLPLTTPISVAVGQTAHVTPVDQNCDPIPNDANNVISLLQMTGVATWALDSTGPGINITGAAVGSANSVQIQWKDQYTTHPAVKSGFFSVQVVAPPATVTAVGSTSP